MKLGPILLLAVAAVCLALALADQLRSGDLYGVGSSLRTDREGASAYFEALAQTRKEVDRSYAPLDSTGVSGANILLLRVTASELGKTEFVDSVTALAKQGNRVLLTVHGSVPNAMTPNNWNLIILGVSKKAANEDEEEDQWPVYFKPSADWTTIRSLGNFPVAVERKFGIGSIALCAATWPFLNLALRDNRDIQILEWAAGTSERIIFDESHLGSSQSGTIMGLLRRLRLLGFLAALIVASLLYFWRASVPFPPVQELPDVAGFRLSGSAAHEAMRNLLERRVPPSELMRACVQEWAHDFARRVGPDAVKAASETASVKATPTEQWNQIRGIARKAKSHD